MKALIQKLVETYGPSGYEAEIRAWCAPKSSRRALRSRWMRLAA
jgi:putative aminopeptidase FrvX